MIAKEGSKAVDEVKFLLLVNAPGHTYTPTDATGNPNVQTVPYELGIWVLERRGGGGRAWSGDLIVFVGPGLGHLTDLVLLGEGIFECFFARRGDI